MHSDIVIVAAKRTPMGSFLGALASQTTTQLGATAIEAVLADPKIHKDDIDEVVMGCVLPAGLGQAPARQAALTAGLPKAVPCTTVNKVCGSGMKAVMMAYDAIVAGSASAVVAGGMESMSNAPYLVQKVRSGVRFGHQQLIDHMFFDGLENAYDGQLMGMFAERCARQFSFSREEQDAYAIESVKRALHAVESGVFADEIVAVRIAERGEEKVVAQDEQPFRCNIDKVPKLKPAFDKANGTVTAANSSSISDGAAALLVMREDIARAAGLTPLARVGGHATHAQAPEDFTTAPVGAVTKLLDKLGWSATEVDLYEINEAFAVVAMAAIRELGLDASRVNVNGGACALGHPIGASGARLIVTLLYAMRARGLRRGVASLCIGGGEATAVGLELY